jgi:hypothetical protein
MLHNLVHDNASIVVGLTQTHDKGCPSFRPLHKNARLSFKMQFRTLTVPILSLLSFTLSALVHLHVLKARVNKEEGEHSLQMRNAELAEYIKTVDKPRYK